MFIFVVKIKPKKAFINYEFVCLFVFVCFVLYECNLSRFVCSCVCDCVLKVIPIV